MVFFKKKVHLTFGPLEKTQRIVTDVRYTIYKKEIQDFCLLVNIPLGRLHI